MKTRIVKPLLLVLFVAMASPSFSRTEKAVTTILENRDEEALRLNKRLEEIQAIDKHTLSKSEKKALRGEVRMIKHELAEISGGVYLSVGAILLIALLLILLL